MKFQSNLARENSHKHTFHTKYCYLLFDIYKTDLVTLNSWTCQNTNNLNHVNIMVKVLRIAIVSVNQSIYTFQSLFSSTLTKQYD